MPGEPVRLLIASPEPTVRAGLRAMLATHGDRVVVVEDGAADVVLHDGDRGGDGDLDALMRRPGAAAWVPLRGGVERIVAMVEGAAQRPGSPAGFGLSDREEEVLALIVAGLSNREIAERAFISINSVKTYIRSAYRKIGVSSRSQAVAWGLRNGLDQSRDAVSP
ncbi:helix-turn-helix transcriptional regulator [Nocardioides sp. MAH-18]|uniref:Helix-turn-helix transcriptional regulator n=1 Tax=Nocardioides agri TaxID=2682843 RepID=A0A6L6XT47_9ACTN|nr:MULTISPECIES: response regulator transcription factor [unclassified Nocardioides]MBA2955519.1 response regulator transcription factor [Nocardioides sp. CGMCC 1.13656]MVQ50369.1 helix-turn-helix transcriptional regulator [Nocardioides sp. MAH-18]